MIIADVLDGAMILAAMWTLNIFHPGRMLPKDAPRLASGSDVTLEQNMHQVFGLKGDLSAAHVDSSASSANASRDPKAGQAWV